MNRFSIEGKTAIVTGANSGIGLAITQGFINAGAKVITTTRSSDMSEELAAALTSGASAYIVDISNQESIEDFYNYVLRDIGVDILVNCAGISSPTRWNKTIDTNLTGTYFMIKLVSSTMNPGGSIINVTSIGSMIGFPGNPAYVASKGGLRFLTKAMAVDLAEENIRVNNLCPGYFRTKMTEGSRQDLNKFAERIGRMLIKRFGNPEELIGPAIFLASDASSYMTGADLVIDGGWTANGL